MPQTAELQPRERAAIGDPAHLRGLEMDPAAPGSDNDEDQYLSVRVLREQFMDYLVVKTDEIEEQKDARRYYHGAHWTGADLCVLRDRHQPPSTWNRIARKINGIVGLLERMRSDPKALARTPKAEPGAEIATQSIRYVLDAAMFKQIDSWCLLQCAIEGAAGVKKVLTRGDKGDLDISIEVVIGDEYFYDPQVFRMDFGDKRYEGVSKWIDLDDAIQLFPDKEDELRGLVEGDSDLTTNSDRDFKWVITATKRMRLCEHWYRHKGKWCWAFYVGLTMLEEGTSPFIDEKNQSQSAFRMFRAAVDQDSDHYGFVRNLRGPQDTLNQGKSKQLHIANSRRLLLEKGAVDDVETARREWSRPDGVVEINPGKTVKPDDTKTELAAFAAFTEDAKAELDQFANVNMQVLTGPTLANISGRAIELLRQPGMAELQPFIESWKSWKLALYRDIWNAVQRYWSAERWIRVTNNDGIAQFIQLNGLGMDQMGRPTIVNHVGAVDVDVIIEEGPDIASLMQDTYDALKGFPPGTIPPQVLIEMNPNIPRSEKNRYLQMLQPKPQQPDPAMEMLKKLTLEEKAGKNAKTAAETQKIQAGVEDTFASAEKKRAEAGTAVARAGHLAHSAHLDAAEFAHSALMEAIGVTQGGAQDAKPEAKPAQREQAPFPGAMKARDGNHYVADPHRPGKYLRVA